MKPEFRGEKLGELLLKQALWFAQRNKFELIYVTTFPDQTFLIQILEYFGFQNTHTLSNGECVFEKQIFRTQLMPEDGKDLFALDRQNYPRFITSAPVTAYCVPIKGAYHRKLFPEIAILEPLPLFHEKTLYRVGGETRTPGNTIRKVYLCRAQAGRMKSGDLLFFYESKSPDFIASQSITTVGILEAVNSTNNLDELARLTAKRSVFSLDDLKELIEAQPSPVKILDFLLVGHLEPPMRLSELIGAKIFSRSPPQSIIRLPPMALEHFKARMNFGFEV